MAFIDRSDIGAWVFAGDKVYGYACAVLNEPSGKWGQRGCLIVPMWQMLADIERKMSDEETKTECKVTFP
jgi:hypothetical protein